STVMSVDQDCSSEIAAMIGSSIALSISDIPFDGPIAGINIGRINNQLVINPSIEEQGESDLELTVAGTKDAINMVEAGADEVSEEAMLEAILYANEVIFAKVEEQAKEKLTAAIQVEEKHAREEAISAVKEEIIEQYEDEDEISHVKMTLDDLVKTEVRRLITEEKVRPDGRNIDEIRPLSSRVSILPRTHGSGLFTRGQTQVLSVSTLGALGDVQILDGLDLEESKRFMHHYNFPQYSVGETGPIRAPGRREIGHGALGERALEKVIPSDEAFPYTIRVVSEVLESNGSSSM